MTKLFISDLHLHQTRPEVTGIFQDFIDELLTITTPNPELYILGDLFEFWIGDDFEDPLYSEITNQLKNLVKSGIKNDPAADLRLVVIPLMVTLAFMMNLGSRTFVK